MEKVNYKRGRFNILTTIVGDFDYSDYVEWCDINGVEPQGEDSEGYYNWCAEVTDDSYLQDLENIENCEKYQLPVVITGVLHLWSGSHEINPKVYYSVDEAIRNCTRNADDVEAYYDDGKIEVHAIHHDGTNVFYIQALSKKGNDKMERYGYIEELKKEDTKRLPYLYGV